MIVCEACGVALDPEARFCGGCGQRRRSGLTGEINLSGITEITVTADQAAAPLVQPTEKSESDLSGVTLNGRYQIESRLGKGGFGSVYRARQLQMNREVALKILHPHMAADPQLVERFKREAQASSKLRAPHTVMVYDFDQTEDGTLYMAMELLRGRSLGHAIGEEGALSPERVVVILDGIADSLEEAHAQGIVHRDIKPENVYLESKPTADFVKVLDFGIAKIISGAPALTAAGQTLGTLEYMSPEQLMGESLDGRSDLYALGVLGYEMLTGRHPFEARSAGELISAHLRKVPPPVSTLSKTHVVPPALERILMRLLAKKRDDRHADAAALRNDLLGALKRASEPALKRDPVRSPPAKIDPPTEQLQRGNRRMLIAATILGAVTALAFGLAFWFFR